MTSYSEYDRGYENGVQDTLDENPPLKWTTEPPKEEGWHGATEKGRPDEIVHVIPTSKGLRVLRAGAARAMYLRRFWRWSGPFRLPGGDEK